MNIYSFWICKFFLFALFSSPCHSSGPYVESLTGQSSWENAKQYAERHLPHLGQLCRKSDGYVYLKVDNEYIHTLFSLLNIAKDGFKEPPYFRSVEAPGAHISVFYAEEGIFPEELGQTFHFTLKQIVLIKKTKSDHVVLQVKSPELAKLRQKYGLSSKIHGHDYHISLAKKYVNY